MSQKEENKVKKMKIAGKAVLAEDFQQQIAELTEALQRERADAMNLRRRHEDQIASMQTNVKVNVIKDLLPILDNLELSIKHIPADLADHEYIKGVQAIVKQFEKTFSSLGIERIATVDEEFNPHLHEAISMEEGDCEKEIITEELRSGYKIGDDVIRHAMVRVKG